MADSTNLSIRLDKDLKDQADKIFGAMGMSLTTAITVFVRQAVRQKKIPFEITLSDGEDVKITLQEAMVATERMWQNSIKNGTDKMTMDEINAEIAAYRAERRAAT